MTDTKHTSLIQFDGPEVDEFLNAATERDHLKNVNAELLEALEKMVKRMVHMHPITEEAGDVINARAAIAKAKGQ